MSYNGTVRCGHCYNQGHNRLGCPERKREALERPDSYLGRQYAREQESRKQSIASRVCSYCKEPNHNRRGCKILKEDKQLIKKRQIEYKKEFLNATSSAGFGPGALVKVRKDDSKGFVAMITNIYWHEVDFLLKDTDLSSGWRDLERPIAESRVVSSYGYDDEDKENYWNAPPKFNDIQKITANNLHLILAPVFNSHSRFDKEKAATLVGPVYTSMTTPESLNDITHRLDSSFHLTPGPRADDWDKRRVELHNDQWSKIRPESHEKHAQEHAQTRKKNGW